MYIAVKVFLAGIVAFQIGLMMAVSRSSLHLESLGLGLVWLNLVYNLHDNLKVSLWGWTVKKSESQDQDNAPLVGHANARLAESPPHPFTLCLWINLKVCIFIAVPFACRISV
jgi:hypothetical protein